MGGRLGAAGSLGGGASQEAFLVLRQLLDTSRAGEGSVPAARTSGLSAVLPGPTASRACAWGARLHPA